MMKTITKNNVMSFIDSIFGQTNMTTSPQLTNRNATNDHGSKGMDLSQAKMNQEYIIKEVASENKDILNFLFSLGCFKHQTITVISSLSETFVIVIKDARYSIDVDLAKAIKLY